MENDNLHYGINYIYVSICMCVFMYIWVCVCVCNDTRTSTFKTCILFALLYDCEIWALCLSVGVLSAKVFLSNFAYILEILSVLLELASFVSIKAILQRCKLSWASFIDRREDKNILSVYSIQKNGLGKKFHTSWIYDTNWFSDINMT